MSDTPRARLQALRERVRPLRWGTRFTPLAAALALQACGPPPPAPVAAPASSQEKPVMTDLAQLARQHVEALAAGRSEDVFSSFDDAMKQAMPIVDLRRLWADLVAQAGPLESIDKVRIVKKDQLDIVIVTCSFDKAMLDIQWVLDPERHVAGLFVRPADQGDAWTAPSYAQPAEIEEVEVTFGAGDWVLPATLTMPSAGARREGGCPGVVLVHGSGPNDRDESIGPNKPFKDLAWGLASRGVCVLRYEKRTRQHGKLVMERVGDALTVKEETVDDALLAADMLRKHASIDPERVFVLGHSLGGYAIPRVAKRGAGIQGFIILAGSTRPLEDLVLEQVTYIANIDGLVSELEAQSIAKLTKQVAAAKALTAGSKTAANELPLGIAPAYWLDLRANDPLELIAGETRPLLVLQGARDYQVTNADFIGWEKALAGHEHAVLKRYPALNHLFIAGEGKSTPAEYQQPGHVALEVVEDIAAFVHRP